MSELIFGLTNWNKIRLPDACFDAKYATVESCFFDNIPNIQDEWQRISTAEKHCFLYTTEGAEREALVPDVRFTYEFESEPEQRVCVVDGCDFTELLDLVKHFGFLSDMPDKLSPTLDFIRVNCLELNLGLFSISTVHLSLHLTTSTFSLPRNVCEACIDFNYKQFEGDIDQKSELVDFYQQKGFLVFGPGYG